MLPKYLERRVTEAARGAVDVAVGKALAEHGQILAKERERFSRDYGLFAEKRNAVYAEAYSLLTHALGSYAPYFRRGLTSHPDFNSTPERELHAFVLELEFVSESERRDVSTLLTRDLAQGRKALEALHRKSALRQANSKFTEFKNWVVLNALYFDREVEAAIDAVLRPMALLSIHASELIAGDDIPYRERTKAFDEAEQASTGLRELMRMEMRAGFLSKEQTDLDS